MNNHHDSTENILKRIEAAGVRPIPRRYFSLRNIGMWVLAALSVIVGGLAVSSIIFRLVNIPRVLPPGLELQLPLMVRLIPFLWIVLLAIFSLLAYREIRATKRGYRYELPALVLGLLVASLIFGIGFYATGVGARLDLFTGRHMPFLAQLEHEQREQWMRPERGFLVGTVTSTSDEMFVLIDPKHISWTVLIEDNVSTTSIEKFMRVGVRGEIIKGEGHTFRACDIRSLEFSGEKESPFPHLERLEGERKVRMPRSNTCGDVQPRY